METKKTQKIRKIPFSTAIFINSVVGSVSILTQHLWLLRRYHAIQNSTLLKIFRTIKLIDHKILKFLIKNYSRIVNIFARIIIEYQNILDKMLASHY